MGIDWEVEEGHHEFDKRNGSVTCSVYPGGFDVDLHGEFTYQDIEQILAKMKELQREVKNDN